MFENSPSLALSYVAGAVKGDGSIYRSPVHHNDEIKLAVVDRDFLEAFANSLSTIFPDHKRFSFSTTQDDGYVRFVVRVGSGLLADFLSQSFRELDNQYVRIRQPSLDACSTPRVA